VVAVNEWLVVAGIALIAISGLPGLWLDRTSRRGERIAVRLVVLGAASGIVGSVRALAVPDTIDPIQIAWSIPGGSFHVEVDALSAMFVLQVFAISALAAIYGLGYWAQADHPESGRKLRAFFGLMVAGMALLGVARNLVLFMMGWELMAIGAFITITTEDDQQRVRDAGYLYLIATRVATLSVIAAFALLAIQLGNGELVGTLDADAPLSTAIFVFAFAGCALKAGLMPLHIWLPSAHGNSPSHISAIMSGVLIKMGIYTLLRFTSLFPDPPTWWGGTILAFGVISGVLGVAFAIGQHDLKRLLAYHSVENIGIISMGVGIALIGRATHEPKLVLLGMAGGLLHVWNHGLFKALLFLCAGGVLHATGTREIDHLGGLAKRMKWTALCFVIGAVAICGLPPLNGFVSELLVYLGLIDVAVDRAHPGAFWLVGVLSAALLALIGALAVACFVKVLGAVFLGEPRSREASEAHESPRVMLAPMFVLAGLCFVIGVAAPLISPALDHAVNAWAPELASSLGRTANLAPLAQLALVYVPLVLLVTVVGAWLVRRIRSAPADVGTWDCGYAKPSPRMQYTSSSFAQMLVGTFAWALRPNIKRPHLDGAFPNADVFHSDVPDTVLDRMLVPATERVDEQRRWVMWMQRGHVHAYLAFILGTLVFLLLWKGGS
jgi:hydrogenase-4 component B